MSSQYTSKVRLYKGVPLTNDYTNTLEPATQGIKYSWLNNYDYNDFENIMYPKFNTQTNLGTLRLEAADSNAEDYNYAYIIDSKGKVRFCFILGCRYINDGAKANYSVYEFDLEIDLMMTYVLSKNQFYACPIERHHAVNSHKFNNILSAENVATGPIIHNSYSLSDGAFNLNECWPVLYLTPRTTDTSIRVVNILGVVNGLEMVIVDSSQNIDTINTELNDLVKNYLNGDTSYIMSIAMVPKIFFASKRNVSGYTTLFTPTALNKNFALNVNVDYNSVSLNGYSDIHNKKLCTYPYYFLRVINDVGNHIDLRFEFWDENSTTKQMVITTSGAMLPITAQLAPVNYNGIEASSDSSDLGSKVARDLVIEVSNFPLGSWTSDSYSRYIAQNGKANLISFGGNMLGLATGAVSGASSENPISAVGNAVNGAVNGLIGQLANYQRAKDAPDNTNGDTGNGVTTWLAGRKNFVYTIMCVRQDFAEQIDKYFSRYGYNQNGDIAIPNPTARPKFTYIKTLGNCIRPTYGCNNNQINIINQIMMNGITFWRTSVGKSEFLNFSGIFNSNSNGDVF